MRSIKQLQLLQPRGLRQKQCSRSTPSPCAQGQAALSGVECDVLWLFSYLPAWGRAQHNPRAALLISVPHIGPQSHCGLLQLLGLQPVSTPPQH